MKIACLGDSITAGNGGGVVVPYPQRIEQRLGAGHVAGNYGIGGYTAAQILSRWTTYVRGRGHTHLTLLGGVNDLRAGTTAATVWTSLQTILDQAAADGMRVIVMTVTPWNNAFGQWSSGQQTETETLNTSIRSWVTANLTARLLDTYPMFGGSDATRLATRFDSGDNLHPNQLGTDLFATGVIPLLY